MTEALWYWSRGFGVSSLVLLSTVMSVGALTRGGRALPGVPRYVLAAVHRTLALSVVAFVALHVVLLLADPYAQLQIVDVFVPFANSQYAVWLGLGTLTIDFLVIVVISSLVRDYIGVRFWRAVHWITYACWPLAVVHGLGTGTDAHTEWFRWTTFACVSVVVVACGWRFAIEALEREAQPRRVRPPADLAVHR
jgi:sulfoxide reductase heme-binding subunit YedZ